MNLEAVRSKLVNMGFSVMLKDMEARNLFFELYREVGDPITRTCMVCLSDRFKALQNTTLKNILPMSKRKWRFKKGRKIRKFGSDKVISNLNLTDELAEELMSEEAYQDYFEENEDYEAEAFGEDDEDSSDDENSEPESEDQETDVVEEEDKENEEESRKEEPQKDVMRDLRAQVEQLTGKQPSNRAKESTLRKIIEEAKKAESEL